MFKPLTQSKTFSPVLSLGGDKDIIYRGSSPPEIYHRELSLGLLSLPDVDTSPEIGEQPEAPQSLGRKVSSYIILNCLLANILHTRYQVYLD
jgi:hypothetical protein